MTIILDIQSASSSEDAPDDQSIKRWVSAVLDSKTGDTELSVRIVDEDEGKALNETYRGASGLKRRGKVRLMLFLHLHRRCEHSTQYHLF